METMGLASGEGSVPSAHALLLGPLAVESLVA